VLIAVTILDIFRLLGESALPFLDKVAVDVGFLFYVDRPPENFGVITGFDPGTPSGKCVRTSGNQSTAVSTCAFSREAFAIFFGGAFDACQGRWLGAVCRFHLAAPPGFVLKLKFCLKRIAKFIFQ
jgi:hypothetical protein